MICHEDKRNKTSLSVNITLLRASSSFSIACSFEVQSRIETTSNNLKFFLISRAFTAQAFHTKLWEYF